MENLNSVEKKTRAFSKPEDYIEAFEECLASKEESDEKSLDIDWMSAVSLYAQTMKTEIGDKFKEEEKEKIKDFIEESLSGPMSIGEGKKFIEEMIPVLEDIVDSNDLDEMAV